MPRATNLANHIIRERSLAMAVRGQTASIACASLHVRAYSNANQMLFSGQRQIFFFSKFPAKSRRSAFVKSFGRRQTYVGPNQDTWRQRSAIGV